jgi:hypothetical protein
LSERTWWCSAWKRSRFRVTRSLCWQKFSRRMRKKRRRKSPLSRRLSMSWKILAARRCKSPQRALIQRKRAAIKGWSSQKRSKMTSHNQAIGKEIKKHLWRNISKQSINHRAKKIRMRTRSREPTEARHSRLPRSCAFSICARKMQQYLMKWESRICTSRLATL